MDYTRFLSIVGKLVKPPLIRELYASIPPEVNSQSVAGFPNSSAFPFDEATFTLKHDATEIKISKHEMILCMQYGKTRGFDPLLDMVKTLIYNEHHPPTASNDATPDTRLRHLMSSGAQMALTTIFSMVVSDKYPVLLSVPAFALCAIPLIKDMTEVLSVTVDGDGAVPASLRKALSKWTPEDAKNPDSGIPRVLWLNPTCNNPAGVTTSFERRKEIYGIAHEYNLLIVEDDPYYYLQENQPRIPSYLSLDIDGRVVRIDSFSKIAGPGLRCAFVSGPDTFVERMEYVMMQSSQHVVGLTQMIIYKLLTHWGPSGFEAHLKKVIETNRVRRQHALGLADKWLTGLADWDVPTGGMYLLFKIRGTGLTSFEINERLVDVKRVSLLPATAFYPQDALGDDLAVLRMSIALVAPEIMDKILEGLATVITEARSTISEREKV